jgi:hypothetical protein
VQVNAAYTEKIFLIVVREISFVVHHFKLKIKTLRQLSLLARQHCGVLLSAYFCTGKGEEQFVRGESSLIIKSLSQIPKITIPTHVNTLF